MPAPLVPRAALLRPGRCFRLSRNLRTSQTPLLWFVCPRTGQLAARLHLPSGADTFACRKAYRLAYRSQRQTPCDRAISRAFSLRHKLGDDGGIGDYVTKPKGMHQRTFERAMGRIDRAEDIVDGHAVLLLVRLNRVASR